MENISKSLDKILVDITVKQMLNPENKDFFIGKLTLDKVQSLFAEKDNANISAIDIFWRALHIAETKYKAQLADLAKATFNRISCPECGCAQTSGYVPGVRCPNCDYIEE